ncbi:MAG: SAM hydrolase/SAM-dependent halogenase family protein [bacterium]
MASDVVRAGTLAAWLFLCAVPLRAEPHALVLQTDFGTRDGAVAAMRGVAFGVSSALPIFDLSHENTPYDVWEAAYRLNQTASFWPAGTVFVSVVDPGVGTERLSVVMKTKTGHLFVGPDNGSWTLVAESLGVAGVRQIDEQKHRRPGSERSHTFHGRDVFVYMGAKLAAGLVAFEDVGPDLGTRIVTLPHEKARLENGALVGTIPSLDFRYGNVWTDVGEDLFTGLTPKVGQRFRVTISEGKRVVYSGTVPYARTFGDVPEGQPLLYLNSLMNVAVALNMGDFAKTHGIGYGGAWSVRVERVPD